MRFVDDDREVLPGSLAFHFIEDKRKFLHGGDDDLLPFGDEAAQVPGLLGMADGGAHLHELLDRFLELVVEDVAVGHDDHRIENFLLLLVHPHQLMGEPRDGVRLAAAGRLLDEVAFTNAVIFNI
ncbi:MAG: hypothetical protein WEB53_12775 [Akkermansiaceae bacterium]